MPSVSSNALDAAANHIKNNAEAHHILSAEPANYTEISTYSLGNKASPVISGPSAGSPDGRKVTVDAITDGAVTATGTGSHWCLADNTNSDLLAAQAVAASQAVTNGDIYTTTPADITFRDA